MIQPVSQAEIDRWVRENELRIVPKRPVKPARWKGREPKPWFKPIFAAWVWIKEHLGEAARIPLKSTWRQVLVRYLLDVAKMAIACAIGVALGLMFVWAW